MLNNRQESLSRHKVCDIEALFRQAFYADYRTCLTGGASEPLYKPACNEGDNHYIYYREDFFASALHEASHWCIAGEERRQQLDFGYWYVEDGRNAIEQKAFEAAEVKPQALEFLFSLAANYPFQVSVDNLNGSDLAVDHFKNAVFNQAQRFADYGLPKRAAVFYSVLSEYYQSMRIDELAAYFETNRER